MEVHRCTYTADVTSSLLHASLTDVAFLHAATLLLRKLAGRFQISTGAPSVVATGSLREARQAAASTRPSRGNGAGSGYRSEVGFAGVTGAATKSQAKSFTRGGKTTYEDYSTIFADKRSGEAKSCRSCRRTQRRRKRICKTRKKQDLVSDEARKDSGEDAHKVFGLNPTENRRSCRRRES
ncbi:hypothetical protein U1Q18_012532 [Sarracenia purpurea var. burkii]